MMGTGDEMIRPVAAMVDLDDIRHNVDYLKGLTGPDCRFMAVVKANGYGHGDIEVSRAALSAGADCLGVALLEEAARIRNAGLECPVHLLFEPPAGAAEEVIENGLVCAVYTNELARALSSEAEKAGGKATVHIKVDTGMRRVGIYPEDVPGFAEMLKGLPGVEVKGIFTHFPVADEPDSDFTEKQMDVFERASSVAEEIVGRPLVRHAANSAGVMAFPRSHYDMVRVGIAMYGLSPSSRVPGVENLKPALSLEGRIVFAKRVSAGTGISYGLRYAPERDTNVATLPLGYADGLSRILSGKIDVLIEGRRRPVVGTICMDLCMVDLGSEPVKAGTRFVVIGKSKEEEITADEIAQKLGTINYEVVCMISSRVPRIYSG